MANTPKNAGKGNPASHRMGNDRLKSRRAASWRAGQERKAKRVSAQNARAKANAAARALGQLTPWEARVGVEAAERMKTSRKRRREARQVMLRMMAPR